jgi:hypothetical protein
VKLAPSSLHYNTHSYLLFKVQVLFFQNTQKQAGRYTVLPLDVTLESIALLNRHHQLVVPERVSSGSITAPAGSNDKPFSLRP